MNVLDHEKLHQKYFEELSRIPRASFKEERVSDYLEDFARTRGLDYKRDTIGNVVIYKPASAPPSSRILWRPSIRPTQR